MGRVRFDALVFSRYVASCWIVCYHYWGAGGGGRSAFAGVSASPHLLRQLCRVFRFGTFWTQYFFLLSGFVLAVARLSSKKPDELKPTWRYVCERLTNTYPAYLLSLVLMVFNLAGSSTYPSFLYASRADWINLGLHAFLLQAWWPPMVCGSAVWHERGRIGGTFVSGGIHWNVPAWFMSALAFYWVLFAPLYRALRALPRRALVPAAVALWLCSGAAGADMWLRGVRTKDAPHDFYRYSPLMYVHVFALGMVLARLFLEVVRSEDAADAGAGRALAKHGATLGYAVYAGVALFCSVEGLSGMKKYDDDHAGGRFYFLHNGGLAPLNALLLFGLCSDDAVAAVFKHPALQYVGSISYAQYILQAVVFHLVKAAYDAATFKDGLYANGDMPVPPGVAPGDYLAAPYGPWTFQLVLPGTLFAASFVTHYFVSVPVGAHLRKQLDALGDGLATQGAVAYGTMADSKVAPAAKAPPV